MRWPGRDIKPITTPPKMDDSIDVDSFYSDDGKGKKTFNEESMVNRVLEMVEVKKPLQNLKLDLGT
jgi:hypothetical protein